MPSPFPGMDPYLEAFWRDIHASLLVHCRDQINERLPADLVARAEQGVALNYATNESARTVWPDVALTEEAPGTRVPLGSGAVVATPSRLATVAESLVVDVEPLERHVEIRDPQDRVVTVIEFLSPTNKQPGFGQESYRRKQADYLAAGVNLLEVDLLRLGTYTLAAPASAVPPTWRKPYLACVRRAALPREARLFHLPLQEPIKALPIPLRPTDNVVLLELQPVLTQCYSRGRYDRIDYSRPPEPPFGAEDAVWAAERLRLAGRKV